MCVKKKKKERQKLPLSSLRGDIGGSGYEPGGERVVGHHLCCILTGQWGRLQISASGFFALQSPLSTSSSEARQPTLLLIAHCLARLSEGGNLKK